MEQVEIETFYLKSINLDPEAFSPYSITHKKKAQSIDETNVYTAQKRG